MKQRPELREEDYRRRISASDTRRAVLSALPNLSFNAGYQYDSNKYLYNQSWAQAGLRFSADLFRLLSVGSIKRAGKAQLAVDDTRRLAQAMAILTQVRVAALRYNLSRDELNILSASAQVDQRLANFAKASASSRVDSELELIRTEARAVLSSYQRQIAYANAQGAWGRLYNSLGLDLTPTETEVNLNQLSQAIGDSMRAWRTGIFGQPVVATKELEQAPTQQVRLVIDGVEGQLREGVRDGLVTALRQQGIGVNGNETTSWELSVNATVDKNSGRQVPVANWQMTLENGDGVTAANAQYITEIPGHLNADTLSEVSRLAVDAYADIIAERLKQVAVAQK